VFWLLDPPHDASDAIIVAMANEKNTFFMMFVVLIRLIKK